MWDWETDSNVKMEKKEDKLKPDELGNDSKVRMWELRTSAALKKVLMDGVLVLDMELAKATENKKVKALKDMREDLWDAQWTEQVATGLLDHVELDDKDQHKLLERWQAKAEVLGAARPARPVQAAAVAEEKTAQQADRLAKHLTAELLDFLCCAVRAESADAVKKRSAQLRLTETVEFRKGRLTK